MNAQLRRVALALLMTLPAMRDLQNVATQAGPRARVALQLHDGASVNQYRELGMFVRDRISRIERSVDRADSWTIKITRNPVCFCADVTVEDAGTVVQAVGAGFDGAVAAWDAFAKVEARLREQRAYRDTVAVAVS